MSATQGNVVADGMPRPKAAPPCIFVLFGATGDLAARKIAPALYNLARDGLLGENVAVMGVARRPRSDDVFREEMLAAIARHSRSGPADETLWRDMSRRWGYHVAHAGRPEGYDTLAARLNETDAKYGTGGNRIFYLATTPEIWPDVVAELRRVGLNKPGAGGRFVRLIVEKPFGSDLAGARRLDESLREAFDEPQIFRIDHYLGKETVQNILVFRFANLIFEPLFNRQWVHSVQLTTAETVGMEQRRGPYYESTGALRDMLQNHMLQLLALTAMEVPGRMDGEAIRDEKVKVLRSIPPLSPDQVAHRTARGQYLGDADGPAYREETGVAPDSRVETYAAVKLEIDNWRWAGVPFYLRTGKRLPVKTSQVVIEFKREPVDMFNQLGCDMSGSNLLCMRITPNEGISLIFDAKVPGPKMMLRPVRMNFGYESTFESATPEAYERLLLDALGGDPTLFIRDDEVEASWQVVDSIRKGWDTDGLPELVEYPPGSWGPEQAEQLFGDPYEHWYNVEPR